MKKTEWIDGYGNIVRYLRAFSFNEIKKKPYRLKGISYFDAHKLHTQHTHLTTALAAFNHITSEYVSQSITSMQWISFKWIKLDVWC